MTGSTAKSAEDSSSNLDKKRAEKTKLNSSLSAVVKMEIDIADSPATSKESTVDGQDGLLDALDEYAEEYSSAASVKIDQEEKVAVKSPKRNTPNKKIFDNPEGLGLRNDNSAEYNKIDEPLVSTNNDKEKIAKSAKADSSKFFKTTDKALLKNKMIWVCNILPSTKASELKTHFSKHAKVTTARVVTNGRKYYGCLTVEDEESVKECIKQSNKTIIDGQEIKVQANAPDNDDDDSTEKRTNNNNNTNNNNKRICAEKSISSETRSRPLRKFDKQSEKPDLLTRVIKSPEKPHTTTKEAQQEKPKKRHRSRSTSSIESETRKKVLELRRLTADVEEMQRRKERMITEEKEKERDRRENERIQEMRRKMEEERAHKRMEIELAKKKLEFERKLLEKERDAFMKLKNIEMEELRIRAETKRKIEEADEYQRKAKISKDRKITPSPKRYQQQFDTSKQQQQQHRGNNRNHSPNLYQSSQKFDIKPLKRDDDADKYPSPPKISSSINYNQRSSNKSTNNYYTQKEHRYKNNTNSNNNSKYSSSCSKSTNDSGGKSDAQDSYKATSTWLPSALSLSSGNYRQQQLQLMNEHRGDETPMQVPWQQHGTSSGGKLGRYHHEQQQQQQQPYHHGGGMRHPVQYPPQLMDGVGKGAGRSGGGYQNQSGRRY